LLQRRNQRLLRQVLGHTHIAHHAREPGNQLCRLDPPDRLDTSINLAPAYIRVM
jgi:hypothetical protein